MMEPRRRKRKPRRKSKLETAIAVVLLVAAGVMVAFLLVGQKLIRKERQARRATVAATTPARPLPPSPMAPAALKALEGFCEAQDLEAKAVFVRDPERVWPLMEDYHGKRGHPFPSLGRVSPGKEIRLDESPAVFFEVEPFSGARYPVAVVWDGARFAVDWESHSSHSMVP